MEFDFEPPPPITQIQQTLQAAHCARCNENRKANGGLFFGEVKFAETCVTVPIGKIVQTLGALRLEATGRTCDSLFHLADFVDSPLVTAALKAGLEPDIDDILVLRVRDEITGKTKNIGVVVTAA